MMKSQISSLLPLSVVGTEWYRNGVGMRKDHFLELGSILHLRSVQRKCFSFLSRKGEWLLDFWHLKTGMGITEDEKKWTLLTPEFFQSLAPFIFIFLFLRQIEACGNSALYLMWPCPRYFRKIMMVTAIFRKYTIKTGLPALERRTN